ncbi:GGDEF domain-containing protein [Metabacillus malikii]|uniref:Diguanylate cyclase (GGDEF)-like protein n=1 Tax=Metabacillus malikii TaxID=1504265 RepID=A0ABT9ZAT7_9BACI|nr:GGDEF domain-containing protein [Metabacillus malikii]MDQ0229362.1 diguanylate cyclase (GGDEF)-like protein [Metabacillus malikii]
MLKKAPFIRIHEYINILLISVYLFWKFFTTIKVEFLVQLDDSLGDFIIWMPLFIIYLFLTLGKKAGLSTSLVVLSLHFLIGVYFYNDLTRMQVDSIIRYYIACLIYIVVVYTFQYITAVHTEYQTVREMAYIDPLTNIANRRKVSIVFDQYINKAANKEKALSVLFFDIDYFKQINDQYGHDCGDLVLKEFAFTLSSSLNKHEFIGRWGGEEFIVLTTRSLAEAVNLADLLREIIVKNDFPIVKQVTTSVGVASYVAGDTKDTLLKRADSALYKAKDMGRNCVAKSLP